MVDGLNFPAGPPAPKESIGESDNLTPSAAGPDWSYYPRAVYRRRWLALTVLFLAAVLGVLRNIKAVPLYEATVRVLVEPERVSIVKIDDPVSNGTSSDANIAILRSRWLVRKTLEAVGTWPADSAPLQATAPAVVASAAAPQAKGMRELWSRAVGTLKNAYGLSAPPVGPRIGETAEQSGRIDGFLGGLDATLSSAGILDITYRSSDPVEAATLANAHATQYISQTYERRFEAVKEVTDWLAVRLAEQRQKLDSSEVALAKFRDQNRFPVAGSQSPAVTRLDSLTTDLTRARTVRLEKEALLNRALAARADPALLDRVPQIAASGTVQQLKLELERLQRDRAQLSQTMREKHPDMIKLQNTIAATQSRLDDERARILTLMRDEVTLAATSETTLSEQLESVKGEALSQNRKGLELSILTREVESNRQIYDMLVQRARDADIAKDINPSRSRILDRARAPQVPVSPNKRRDLMLALAMGLGLAILLPLGFEFIDNRIRSPEELQASLGLPFLGLIPEVRSRWRSNGNKRAFPLISSGVTPQFLECVRHVRTNIVFSFPEGPSRSMVVTSAGPSEGKTVVACNLAVALAQLGQRVLLVDGDMRRPKVHEFFDVPAEPGLSNVLVGDAKASQSVHKMSALNLWVLTAGHRPPNPCDLLGSDSFRRLLSAVREQFDWILIDAPPVLAVTDATVISNTATGVLFVVGSERVTRPAARRAIEQLMTARAKFAGAVLCRVDLVGQAYYYAHYYRHKYNDYYTDQPSDGNDTAQAV